MLKDAHLRNFIGHPSITYITELASCFAHASRQRERERERERESGALRALFLHVEAVTRVR
jgi:hypothetical protein